MSTWKRPSLEVRAPNRRLGGLYRSADSERDGTTLAGVPLQTVSDAVVATVKLGYRVADRQIARGRRIGRQLHGAARQAGADDPNAVIDQSERLLLQALSLGLEWLEGSVSAPSGPLRRLLQAEYRWLGRLAGFEAASTATSPAAPAAPVAPGGSKAGAEAPVPTAASGALAPAADQALPVLHTAAEADRRPVVVCSARFDRTRDLPITLHFQHAGGSPDACVGELRQHRGQTVLALAARRALAAGIWRAAVCDADGLQIGRIEIEL